MKIDIDKMTEAERIKLNHLIVQRLKFLESAQLWNVYRQGKELVDPDTRESLGYEAIYLGDARLMRQDDVSKLQVVVANQEIHRTDRLTPSPGMVIVSYNPRAPEKPITGRIMDSAPELRIITKCSIGVDDVDVDAATERGILVTHDPTESNWSGVAEGTVAILLALLKKIRERDEAVKQGKWREPSLQGIYVGRQQAGYAGLTLGIVGLGRIGRRFADLMAPWRVRILAYDPYVEESRFILCNAERVDLQALLKESDVVSLHVVLTEETRRMIGAEEFALMSRVQFSSIRHAVRW